jgi:catechol 2,3-dioxygenase-like lactoylglutathione lyase family enzyme/ribosomal protein S18 acetylase RimI-like enzyme
MLGHLSFGVNDLDRAAAFYDSILAPLGYIRVWTGPNGVGFGEKGAGDKLALFPKAGQVAPGPGFHLAFIAPSREAVDAFHVAAINAGAIDCGAPGLRPHYGATYYAAFVVDPDGYKLEAVHQQARKVGKPSPANPATKHAMIMVRQATTADAELVSALNADVQAIHAAALPERFKPPSSESFPPAEAYALLGKPDTFVFLAHIDQEPAGYTYAEVIRRPETSLTSAYEMVHVHHISVGSQYRRNGVGSALLQAVRVCGLERGIPLLTLDIWSFNEGARAFFRRQGFDQYIERLWCS